MFTCPQCDFISQNESIFNEHITKAHAGQPTCPFCFVGFRDYPSIRKHCETSHIELRVQEDKKRRNVPEGRKRPCRYFRNGRGHCQPRSGTCEFDHTIISDGEREICFHKEACRYKPYCIFLHPEGQGDNGWQINRSKVSKICRFAEQGEQCMRTVCNFYHPDVRNTNLGFHWDQYRKPPLEESQEMMTSTGKIPSMPVRIPVIVRNNLLSRKEFPDLSQKLKGMSLD